MSNRLVMAGRVARLVPHEVLPAALPARAGALTKALRWLRGDETAMLSARLRRDVGLGEMVATGMPFEIERSRLRA